MKLSGYVIGADTIQNELWSEGKILHEIFNFQKKSKLLQESNKYHDAPEIL